VARTKPDAPTRNVICKSCSKAIPLLSDNVGREFSVKCPLCGRRNFYSVEEVKVGRAE